MWIAYILVCIACCMDIKQRRISNRLILIGLCIAIVRRCMLKGIIGIVEVLFLSSFPVILLYLLFLAGILGAGDIKLFSLIGGFLNFRQLVMCIVYAFIAAAVFSLGKMLMYGNLKSGLRHGIQYLFQISNGCKKAYQAESKKEHYICFSIPVLIGLWASQNFRF